MNTQTKQLSLLETKLVRGAVNFEEPLPCAYHQRNSQGGILPRHMQIAIDNAPDGERFDLIN
jgi:hypothetical protein